MEFECFFSTSEFHKLFLILFVLRYGSRDRNMQMIKLKTSLLVFKTIPILPCISRHFIGL